MFSCEFCEISKNTFFYRVPSVAAYEDKIHAYFLWFQGVCVLFKHLNDSDNIERGGGGRRGSYRNLPTQAQAQT